MGCKCCLSFESLPEDWQTFLKPDKNKIFSVLFTLVVVCMFKQWTTTNDAFDQGAAWITSKVLYIFPFPKLGGLNDWQDHHFTDPNPVMVSSSRGSYIWNTIRQDFLKPFLWTSWFQSWFGQSLGLMPEGSRLMHFARKLRRTRKSFSTSI